MRFEVLINGNLSIPLNRITFFDYTVNLFNLYSYCKITATEIAKDAFNIIKLGTPITVNFITDTTTYQNNMRVYRFNKIPTQEGLVDTLEVELISSWYFVTGMQDVAYDGTVGSIINKIATEKFAKEVSIDIASTEEAPSRRYQTGEEIHDFIGRILKYGLKGQFPVYLYTDAKGNLVLKGINDFLNKSAYYTALPDDSLSNYLDNNTTTKKIRLNKYRFSTDITNAHSYYRTQFTTEHFIASVSNVVNDFTLSNPEIRNPQSQCYSAPKNTIRGWEYTPEDALAISAKESFEASVNIFYISAVVNDFVFDGFEVGNLVNVILPYERILNPYTGKEQNLGEGNYLITESHYIYEDGVLKTKVHMNQVSAKEY